MRFICESSLDEFQAWSGGLDTLNTLIENGDCDDVECLIEMTWPDDEPPTETEINDFLWFSRDEIAEHLGYDDWEDYEARHNDDDDEDEDEDEE